MDNKKKVAAALAAAIAASGAAVDASFDDPAQILQADAGIEPQVQYVDLGSDQDAAQDEDKNKQAVVTQKQGTLQAWILHLPLAVRAVVVLPLWFIGHLLVMGGEFVFAGLSPILHWILGFLLIAAVIAGAFTAAAKAMFPDLPLGRILNRHSIKGILIAAACAWLADIVLEVTWAGYAQFKALFLACFTLIAITSVVVWFARREHRRRTKLEAEAAAVEYIEEEPEELIYTSLGETFHVRQNRE